MEYFPDEGKAIHPYFSDFKKMISNVGAYNPAVVPEKDLSMQYAGSLEDYFNSIGMTEALKNVLSSNNPLYGISRKECPMLTHFIVSDSYLNSSFRINEEKTPFAKTLVDIFKSHGGGGGGGNE
ncbi:MAG: hypothetical protein KKF30_16035 [Proteobacteria bacterium]|nr:hypothetical protein [Pseudomonadota bacterium]MBU4472066.1 hypothetical protein [Pseudomonadota bacterium]MCG2752936.1 hypothetical protein [Desulfobacteraceae bacterium]